MRRAPLPPHLAGSSFRTSDAIADGVARDRLRAADLVAPFHGVRAPAGARPASILERCRELLPRLAPLQFFSHATAAGLWDIPLPTWASIGALHVSAIRPAREPRTAGVVGHRLQIGVESLTLVRGMPVPDPAETWAQLGALLTLDDLVIAADAILHHGIGDLEQMAEAAARLRRRGGKSLRAALDEARPGAESPRETKTRLVLTRGGLPQPELNWELRAADGRFVARLDMAYPEHRVGVEYDGRQHAAPAQFARDADRWADIEAQGWTLIRILNHHFARPQRDILSRVRRALTLRGWH